MSMPRDIAAWRCIALRRVGNRFLTCPSGIGDRVCTDRVFAHGTNIFTLRRYRSFFERLLAI